jgi:hypothetical protein
MNIADFFHRFLDASKKDGYSFFFDGKEFQAPQMSINRQILVRSLMSLAGLPGFQHSGFYKQHNNEALFEDLRRLQNHCDLIGIKDSYGSCLLRTLISADDITDESLVGRLAIIHEQSQNFQKYTMTVLRVRPWLRKILGGPKLSVKCLVFLAFSNHKRAMEFSENHLVKCKHRAVWKHLFTYPYVVDLEDEIIQSFTGEKDEKLSNSIFKQHQPANAP